MSGFLIARFACTVLYSVIANRVVVVTGPMHLTDVHMSSQPLLHDLPYVPVGIALIGRFTQFMQE